MIASDLTTGQNPTGGFTEIATVGVSQSSLMGDKSYGATGMLWSTLNQAALSLSYTKTHFVKGKLNSIGSYSSTSAYLKGTLMQMVGYTWVKPSPKYGVYGISIGGIGLFIPNNRTYTVSDSAGLMDLFGKYKKAYYTYHTGDSVIVKHRGYNANVATSAVVFWMPKPYIINKRLSVSPQIFIMGSPIAYNPITGLSVNKAVGMMVGDSWDYKITKRFGMTAAHRVMIPPTGKVLNFLLIGSRMML